MNPCKTHYHIVYKHLKLGYDVLSEDDDRLKDCFLSFVAFPEDHEFCFTEIFCRWVGEGWVPGNGEDDARADALSLVNKLCDRSFIESIELAEEFVISDEYFLAFKIHDVMRDVAFYILENDSGVRPGLLYRVGLNLKEIPQEMKATLEQPSNVQKLSLYGNKLEELPDNWYAPELISLVLGENPMEFSAMNFLSNFPKLRILDLRNGEFDILPEEIGDLESLVYLNLSECMDLETIPDTVRKLRKLKCLLLVRCEKLEYLPSRIVGLTSLEILDTSLCEKLTWAEHTPSAMARGELQDHIFPTNKASFEDICKLVTLTELCIWRVVKVPQNIEALKNLKILNLIHVKVRSLPDNMPHWCIQL